mmetsp:Transcript_37259/g.111563  ORF Transcript_37259/g.111563 Transcript_37259/m.111563 type:complete len:101 (-) Transcript_37259:502-804(-)
MMRAKCMDRLMIGIVVLSMNHANPTVLMPTTMAHPVLVHIATVGKELTLYLAMILPSRAAWAINKCTENMILGIATVYHLRMKCTYSHLNDMSIQPVGPW